MPRAGVVGRVAFDANLDRLHGVVEEASSTHILTLWTFLTLRTAAFGAS